MRVRGPRATPWMTDTGLVRCAAAFASAGAAAVHVAVTPDHLREWLPSGLFFIAVGSFQLAWAVAALAVPRRPLLYAGAALNAVSVLVWAVSRTTGIPMGPQAGVPEAVSRVDLLAVVLESVVCVAAIWAARRHSERTFRSVPAYLASVALLGAAASTLTVPALAAAGEHSHAAEHGHPHGDAGHAPGHVHAPPSGGQTGVTAHPTEHPTGGHQHGQPSSEPSPRGEAERTHEHGDDAEHDHDHDHEH